MANALTRKGVEHLLKIASGSDTEAGECGIAFSIVAVLLYHSSSVPTSAPGDPTYGAIGAGGKSFFEVANGNGYTAGGIALSEANWSYDAANNHIQLADQSWTASGGSIAGVAGAMVIDENDNVLAWWEKSPAVTVPAGETFTADDLVIRIA